MVVGRWSYGGRWVELWVLVGGRAMGGGRWVELWW